MQFELLTLPFVIPTRSAATKRNLLFADSFSEAVREKQIPRAKTALGMTTNRGDDSAAPTLITSLSKFQSDSFPNLG